MAYYFDDWQVIMAFIAIYLIFAVTFKVKYKKDWIFILFFTILFVYIAKVIDYTQFPIYIDDEQRALLGPFSLENNFNLMPFIGALSMTSVLNILMLVPFGFGMPLLLKMNVRKTILAGFLFSLLMEMGQAVIGLYAGYTARTVDVNDLIFNTIGALAGYLIFKGFNKIVKRLCLTIEKPTLILRYICSR